MRKPTLLLLLVLPLGACDIAQQSSVSRNLPANRTHVVSRGETLFSIAERYYGNGLEWPHLHESNPWVQDPNVLWVGHKIFVPALGPLAESSPSPTDFSQNPGTGDFEGGQPVRQKGLIKTDNPGNGDPDAGESSGAFRNLFRNILPTLTDKKLFGYSIDKIFFLLIVFFMLHATVQGLIVWVVTNLAFVRDTSIRKSMRASFMTEMVTICSVVLLGVIGLMMVYVGTNSPSGLDLAELFPMVEKYLKRPAGMALAGIGGLALYVILSMRFIPQVFDMQPGRSFSVVSLGVLVPHLIGMYVAGQRMGIIN